MSPRQEGMVETPFKNKSRRLAGAAIAMLALPCLAYAEQPLPPKRPTINMFGVTGLIDTPTAEMQPDANFTATGSYFGGYLRTTLTSQFLPGLEAAFRYSVLNELSAPPGTTLFDRSFDLKLRLLEEQTNLPSVAIGLQDFLGTGVYSGEYIVATKGFGLEEYGNLKVTGGVGWGRFADGNGVKNPLTFLSDRFEDREPDVGVGGNVDFGQFFRGETMGIFGGLEWETPIEGLSAKVEYSPDRYSRERLFGDFEQNAPINTSLEYQANDVSGDRRILHVRQRVRRARHDLGQSIPPGYGLGRRAGAETAQTPVHAGQYRRYRRTR